MLSLHSPVTNGFVGLKKQRNLKQELGALMLACQNSLLACAALAAGWAVITAKETVKPSYDS